MYTKKQTNLYDAYFISLTNVAIVNKMGFIDVANLFLRYLKRGFFCNVFISDRLGLNEFL